MPLDFEDARDQYGSYEFEEWLHRTTAHHKRMRELAKENARKRYERHPRTRISSFLHCLANRIAIQRNTDEV